MSDQNCIFCKIINKEIPSKIILENDHIIVIENISPKAPIHYLIIPKKHIVNINYLTDHDTGICWQILKTAKDLAQQIQQEKKQTDKLDFNLLSNNGAGAGQSVFHMHWHFISGKNIFVDGSEL